MEDFLDKYKEYLDDLYITVSNKLSPFVYSTFIDNWKYCI